MVSARGVKIASKREDQCALYWFDFDAWRGYLSSGMMLYQLIISSHLISSLSMKGAFAPSGYFLKAVFLHSGQAVSRYSDPLYDAEPTRIASFKLLSQPVDVFQGAEKQFILDCLPSHSTKSMSNLLLHHTMICYAMLGYTELYCTILYYTIFKYTVLCYTLH